MPLFNVRRAIEGFLFNRPASCTDFFKIRRRKIMISKVMIIGSGQMGSGIAQVFAQAGFYSLLKRY